MALVLPQGGAVSPQPVKAGTLSKSLPAAAKTASTKAVGHFQALVDRASKSSTTPSAAGKAKIDTKENLAQTLAKTVKKDTLHGSEKSKLSTSATEKELPAKAKKTADPKDPKAEDLAAQGLIPVNLAKDAPTQPIKTAKEAETALAADKSKSVKNLAKGTNDTIQPATVAAIEVAKAQGPAAPPKTERTEEKQKVFVVDRRTDKDHSGGAKTSGAETTLNAPVNANADVLANSKTPDSKVPNADVQVTFQTVQGKSKDSWGAQAGTQVPSPRDALSFQQYLVDRGYGQLVDQARIVLKDNNAGEIRMTLHPDSLGKVKVTLNLDDNSLAGQIFVENQTVKDVFQANMDGLTEAFQDGGWTNVQLQVSVGGQDQGNSAHGDSSSDTPARTYGRQVAQTVAAASGDRISSWNDGQINLTA